MRNLNSRLSRLESLAAPADRPISVDEIRKEPLWAQRFYKFIGRFYVMCAIKICEKPEFIFELLAPPVWEKIRVQNPSNGEMSPAEICILFRSEIMGSGEIPEQRKRELMEILDSEISDAISGIVYEPASGLKT